MTKSISTTWVSSNRSGLRQLVIVFNILRWTRNCLDQGVTFLRQEIRKHCTTNNLLLITSNWTRDTCFNNWARSVNHLWLQLRSQRWIILHVKQRKTNQNTIHTKNGTRSGSKSIAKLIWSKSLIKTCKKGILRGTTATSIDIFKLSSMNYGNRIWMAITNKRR